MVRKWKRFELSTPLLVELLQPALNAVDGRVRSRSAGRETDVLCSVEPFGAQFGAVLHMVDATANPAACGYQFARIVAVGPAYHDD